MKSAAVTTRGKPDESYPAFTARVAEDNARVRAKLAVLDRFIPCCRSCGETCNPGDAGTHCKENNIPMHSQWAHKLAHLEFYNLGFFARGGWSTNADALACLLDRVRAHAEDERP